MSEGARLVHTGSFTGPRDPAPFLRALSRVQSEGVPIRLLLAGRVTQADRVLIAETGADVERLGVLSHRDSLALQRSADALLLLTSNNRGVATGKLFEYLGSRRPIVALASGNEAARIVEETRTGITVPPDNEEAIAVALRTAATGGLRYEPTGLEKFTYPQPTNVLVGLIEEAIAKSQR